jgi:hypothetical protein
MGVDLLFCVARFISGRTNRGVEQNLRNSKMGSPSHFSKDRGFAKDQKRRSKMQNGN